MRLNEKYLDGQTVTATQTIASSRFGLKERKPKETRQSCELRNYLPVDSEKFQSRFPAADSRVATKLSVMTLIISLNECCLEFLSKIKLLLEGRVWHYASK